MIFAARMRDFDFLFHRTPLLTLLCDALKILIQPPHGKQLPTLLQSAMLRSCSQPHPSLSLAGCPGGGRSPQEGGNLRASAKKIASATTPLPKGYLCEASASRHRFSRALDSLSSPGEMVAERESDQLTKIWGKIQDRRTRGYPTYMFPLMIYNHTFPSTGLAFGSAAGQSRRDSVDSSTTDGLTGSKFECVS